MNNVSSAASATDLVGIYFWTKKSDDYLCLLLSGRGQIFSFYDELHSFKIFSRQELRIVANLSCMVGHSYVVGQSNIDIIQNRPLIHITIILIIKTLKQ